MDKVSQNKRSEIMRSVKSKNTRPEMIVRSLLHSYGYRYRLHDGTLPGRPDIIFKSRKKVIFVHGCFWHRHKNCKRASVPSSRQDYWIPKFQNTIARDKCNQKILVHNGWTYLIVWECEIGNPQELISRIREFLEHNDSSIH